MDDLLCDRRNRSPLYVIRPSAKALTHHHVFTFGSPIAGSCSMGIIRRAEARMIPQKKPPPFLISKGGGCKTLCASDQSIAGLLKKNTVLYDFITEISFQRTVCIPLRRLYARSGRLVNKFFCSVNVFPDSCFLRRSS